MAHPQTAFNTTVIADLSCKAETVPTPITHMAAAEEVDIMEAEPDVAILDQRPEQAEGDRHGSRMPTCLEQCSVDQTPRMSIINHRGAQSV